jgi:DegV family protein with EDD domain
VVTTRIVTDGAADLPTEIASRAGIEVVRGPVHVGAAEWSGDLEQFWAELGNDPQLPATEAPSTDALASAYGREGGVLAVHVSAELSRTYAHAVEAAGQVAARVEVVDSRSLSVGTGLLALAAAEAAGAGTEFGGLAERAASWVDQLHVHAVIDDVSFLVHGGRAGLVAAKVGRHTHRHVIAVRGHVIPICQVRHRSEAIRELVEHVGDHVGAGVSRWAVGHGAASDVGEFAERLAGVFGCDPAYVTLLGAPVGSHLGPSSLVVSFFADG